MSAGVLVYILIAEVALAALVWWLFGTDRDAIERSARLPLNSEPAGTTATADETDLIPEEWCRPLPSAKH
jgi:hypothetical protein